MQSPPTNAPRVSIGLPVYNGDKYLGDAIASILGQTFTDFELILCDNASTDQTEAICRDYAARDPRVRYFRNEANIGAAPNFNRAFSLARGDYFKWAAHDDICLPDFLAECVAALDRDPSVVLCTTKIRWIDEHGTPTREYGFELNHIGAPHPRDRFRDLISSKHWCIDVFGLIRRRDLAQTQLIGSFVNSDRVLLAELGLRGRFHRVPQVLFLSRDHPKRSVRSLKIRDRGTWFNPTLKGQILLPYWRTMIEYGWVLHRVSLPLSVRIGCLAPLLRWPIQNREHLWRDFIQAFALWCGLNVNPGDRND